VAPPAVKAPSFPAQGRYVQAMQHPEHYVTDAALAGRIKVASVMVAGRAEPLHWSGNFGTVFKASTPTQTIALRVFHPSTKPEAVHDLAHRYATVEAHFATLAAAKKMPPELLPVAWVSKGLRIDGHDVPIVKSPWVEGDELHDAVAKLVTRPHALEALASSWRGAVRDLGAADIAHGDLQHRNVKVEAGTGNLRFVDYDAMYVPDLKGHMNSEVGHPNFQHPAFHFDAKGNARPSFRPFDASMDHFSSLVIYTSLVALSKHPKLWDTYHNEHTLIFDGHRDFLRPETSPLFAELLQSPHEEVRTLAQKLMGYAKGSPKDVPALDLALGAAGGKKAFATRASLHDGTLARVEGLSLGSQAVSVHGPSTPEAAEAADGAGATAAGRAPGARGTRATSLHAEFPTVVRAIVGNLRAVSSKTPGALIVLQDTSGSMDDAFIAGTSKSEAAANAINGTLADFVHASNQGGAIKDRWNVGVVSYGDGQTLNALDGPLWRRAMNPISLVAHNPRDVLHVADAEGQMVPSPLWVKPRAGGNTPMRRAFEHAAEALTGHEKDLVLAINVTDGASTDGDPTEAVAALARKVARAGGQLLLTNIHISENADPARALVFPTPEEAAHLDKEGRLLYALSSPVPASLAEQLGTRPGARMFAYNAAPDQLALVFRAGSSVAGGAR
jgi:hypothetical protein